MLASIISMAQAPSMRSPVGLTPRRKFYDIHLAHASPTTTEAMLRIGALYGIEEEIRGHAGRASLLGTPGARPATAGRSAGTGWRRRCAPCPPRARLQLPSATRYPTGVLLTRYVDDGLLEIDNSAAERSLRVVVLGRKNYLFMRI